MAEHQPGAVNPLNSLLAASVRSVQDQINFDDDSDDANENVTYNTFVTDMDTNEMIPCYIEEVDLLNIIRQSMRNVNNHRRRLIWKAMKIFPTIWRKRYKFFSSSCAIIDEFLEIE